MLTPLVVAMAAAMVQSQAPSPLTGVWAEQGGSTRARIAPCPGGSPGLCATVVGSGQTVVTGLVPNGTGRWRGRYVADGMNLTANVRMTGTDVVAMTACRLVLCQTVTYRRAR
jgi:uncharacterized protein (DUF2147 family)